MQMLVMMTTTTTTMMMMMMGMQIENPFLRSCFLMRRRHKDQPPDRGHIRMSLQRHSTQTNETKENEQTRSNSDTTNRILERNTDKRIYKQNSFHG